MEENQKYISEEKFQKARKSLIMLAIIIILIGLSVGGGLIIKGISNINAISKQEELEESQKPAKLAEMKSKAEKDKLALEAKIKDLEIKIKDLEAQDKKLEIENIDLQALKQKEFQDSRGFSDKYNEYDKKIQLNQLTSSDLSSQIGSLNSELRSSKFELENGNYDMSNEEFEEEFEKMFKDTKYSIEKTKSAAYIMPGIFIIVASALVSGIILLIAFKRNIAGFAIQQSRPIIKETIEDVVPEMGKAVGGAIKEMAPTMKDAVKEVAPIYSTVAKEIAKGIKEGMKDEETGENK